MFLSIIADSLLPGEQHMSKKQSPSFKSTS